jgi:thioredoxin reductase (NADPH)
MTHPQHGADADAGAGGGGADTPELFDITVIGAGPAGLFCAFYAGLRRARTKIIDSLPELGGQLAALYPEKFVYDMPGYPKVYARDLARNLAEQALATGPTVCLGEHVVEFSREPDGTFRLGTERAVHRTRTVIIAVGAGAFTPKKLGRPAVDDWEGKGVHYVVRGLERFAGKDILIVGGGDSAVDWAHNLEGRARSVTLIHRRNEFRAHEDSVAKLMASTVKVRIPYEVRSVSGEGSVRQAVLMNVQTKETETVPADAVLLNLGFTADLGPIKQWGLETKGGDILVNHRMETTIPGVFACGDVAAYEGKIKLIATGVGEAAVAANYAKNFLDPAAKVFPGHSSSMAAPPGK